MVWLQLFSYHIGGQEEGKIAANWRILQAVLQTQFELCFEKNDYDLDVEIHSEIILPVSPICQHYFRCWGCKNKWEVVLVL